MSLDCGLQQRRVVVQAGEVLIGVGFGFCDSVGFAGVEFLAEPAVGVAVHESAPLCGVVEHGFVGLRSADLICVSSFDHF